jgi:hypothetical protein
VRVLFTDISLYLFPFIFYPHALRPSQAVTTRTRCLSFLLLLFGGLYFLIGS